MVFALKFSLLTGLHTSAGVLAAMMWFAHPAAPPIAHAVLSYCTPAVMSTGETCFLTDDPAPGPRLTEHGWMCPQGYTLMAWRDGVGRCDLNA
jgi:hypothetical protein